MIETVFFAAISSDGYLAGPDGDMSWAEKYLGLDEDYGFTQVMSDSVGAHMTPPGIMNDECGHCPPKIA